MNLKPENLLLEIKELPLIKELKENFPQEAKDVDDLISSLVIGLTNPNSSTEISTNQSIEDNKK